MTCGSSSCCAVCLEEFAPSQVVVLPCKHLLCAGCQDALRRRVPQDLQDLASRKLEEIETTCGFLASAACPLCRSYTHQVDPMLHKYMCELYGYKKAKAFSQIGFLYQLHHNGVPSVLEEKRFVARVLASVTGVPAAHLHFLLRLHQCVDELEMRDSTAQAVPVCILERLSRPFDDIARMCLFNATLERASRLLLAPFSEYEDTLERWISTQKKFIRDSPEGFVLDGTWEACTAQVEGAIEDALARIEARCAMCERPPTYMCARCRKASYCSSECQRKAWKNGHSLMCRYLSSSSPDPFETASSETVEKFIQALRNTFPWGSN